MMKSFKILLLFIFVLIIQYNFAQPGPGGPGGGPPCWPPPCIPIDGGISIFIAIAAFVGYKFSSKSNN